MDFGSTFATSHLSDNERILFATGLRPIIFAWPVLSLLPLVFLAAFFFWAALTGSDGSGQGGVLVLPGAIFLALAALVIVSAIVRYRTTEYVLTTRRVLVKKGFLSRRTTETLLTRIESVKLDQDVLERALGCGTLITVGTGGTHDPIRSMNKPLEFRRRMEEQIASLERANSA